MCVSPDLSTSGITPDANNGIIVDVIFQINGIDIPSDKAFTLYPDPVITQFEEKVVLTAGSSLTVTVSVNYITNLNYFVSISPFYLACPIVHSSSHPSDGTFKNLNLYQKCWIVVKVTLSSWHDVGSCVYSNIYVCRRQIRFLNVSSELSAL